MPSWIHAPGLLPSFQEEYDSELHYAEDCDVVEKDVSELLLEELRQIKENSKRQVEEAKKTNEKKADDSGPYKLAPEAPAPLPYSPPAGVADLPPIPLATPSSGAIPLADAPTEGIIPFAPDLASVDTPLPLAPEYDPMPYAMQEEPVETAREENLYESLVAALQPVIDAIKEISGVGGKGGGDDEPQMAYQIVDEEAEEDKERRKGQKKRVQSFGAAGSLFNKAEDVGVSASRGNFAEAAGGAKSAGGDAMAMLTKSVMGPIDAFNQLTSQISSFVSALNPALMEQFGRVIRDLQATLGVAFEPLMQAATGIAREFGSMLLPAMEALRPIVTQLAGTFMLLAKTYTTYISGLLSALKPLMQVIAELAAAFQPLLTLVYVFLEIIIKLVMLGMTPMLLAFRALAAVMSIMEPYFTLLGVQMQALMAIVEAVVGAIGGWIASMFGGDVKDVMNTLKSMLGGLAKMVILTTAKLLAFIGAQDAYIKSVKRSLGGADKKDNTGIAAAQNVQTGTMSSLASSVVKASLLAGPGGATQTPQEKWQEETLQQLENISNGLPDDVDGMMEALKKIIMEGIMTGIRNALTGQNKWSKEEKMQADTMLKGGKLFFGPALGINPFS